MSTVIGSTNLPVQKRPDAGFRRGNSDLGRDLLELLLAWRGLVVRVVLLFQHLTLGENLNRPPTTRILTQPAARAVLFDGQCLSEEIARVVRDFQDQRVEGTNVDAQLAAATDAECRIDVRERRNLLSEFSADISVVVENRLNGADGATGATIDAEGRIDVVDVVARPVDGVCRATVGASGAANAPFDDFVGHKAPWQPMRLLKTDVSAERPSVYRRA